MDSWKKTVGYRIPTVFLQSYTRSVMRMKTFGIILAFLITILMFWVMFVAKFQHIGIKIGALTVITFGLGMLLTHIANRSKSD